ncbi:hypothetical protein SAMN06309944_0232 [Micrococcales bacterium KH10]|nr:hypothetical protein SAMN06309944_0232 [Micrococcales bacterium KH10]
MTLDRAAIQSRYQAALDAKPGKGPIDPTPIWDSACDVPDLLVEIERLRQEASALPQNATQDATGGGKGAQGGSGGQTGLKSASAGSVLDEIKARAAAATGGPWYWRNSQDVYLLGKSSRCVMAFSRYGMQGGQPEFRGSDNLMTKVAKKNINTFPDATFIAHARQDVPALVTALEAVLLLHSSRPGLLGRPVCEECVEDLGLGDTLPATYPCPTVRAVTEALGATDEAAHEKEERG